ncbi:MAG: ribose-phosphate diphosphokinase [Candidatus Hodgkinia cicadicola]|nr:MAG: ribose-phosphate diphosphokinase [Candidatus Hodgkinia cicadicola]
MKIYTTTHFEVARQTRAYFNFGNKNINIEKFEDGEALVSLPEAVINENVVLIQALTAPVNDSIMLTLFALEALKAACAKTVLLVLTYLAYARQDRQTRVRSITTCAVVCKMLSAYNIRKVYVLEPHSLQAVGFFNVPSSSFELVSAICEHISRACALEDAIIIALDQGAVNRAAKAAQVLGVDMVSGHKLRLKSQLKVAFQRQSKFKNKTGIIIDDVVDSGKSARSAASELATKLGIKRILIYCVHAVLSKGQLKFVELTASNSIPHRKYSIDLTYTLSRIIKRALANKPHDELLQTR